MSDNVSISVTLPVDNQGYSLLQCHYCGTFFKITPTDYRDDEVLFIHCPSCGLVSETYATEDVVELLKNKAENYVNDAIYHALKGLERKHSPKNFQIKVGKKPPSKSENLLWSGIEALEVTTFPCCKRKAKVKPLLKITGCYCPFCGVKNYEIESK